LQLNRGEEGMLDEHGNWRLIQEQVDQNVIYIESKEAGKDERRRKGLIAGIIILALTTLIGLIASLFMFMKYKRTRAVGSADDQSIEV
jgi:hypothetical protein